MPAFSILIVDDEAKLRGLLRRMLELEGYIVFEAEHITKAWEQLERHPEIALLLIDVKLPDGNGIAFLEKVKEKFPGCEAIMMTAYGTIRDGIKAMQLGAFDYLVKGDDNDKLIPAVSRAGEKIAMRRRIETLENRLEEKYRFENILGTSGVIREAIRLAEKVAPTDSTVLLEGETGVGKELFAQAIHTASTRKNHAFVAVNCSAFPKDLLESELFGTKNRRDRAWSRHRQRIHRDAERPYRFDFRKRERSRVLVYPAGCYCSLSFSSSQSIAFSREVNIRVGIAGRLTTIYAFTTSLVAVL